MYAPRVVSSLSMFNSFSRRECFVDVTEIFNHGMLDRETNHRSFKVGFYAFMFVITIYSLTHACVHTFLDEDGKKAAAKLFREAAMTNMYHF